MFLGILPVDCTDVPRQAYFANMSDPSKSARTAFQPPPTLIPIPTGGVPSVVPGDSQGVDNDVTDHLKVQLLVRAYQVHHLLTLLISGPRPS